MPTGKDVAAHLRISDGHFKRLKAQGVFPPVRGSKGYVLDECIQAYHDHLRNMPANGTTQPDESERERQKNVDDYQKERARPYLPTSVRHLST